jgi:membrane associated rhomboid family serine protease
MAMDKVYNTASFSRIFLVFVLALHIVFYFLGQDLINFLALNPRDVIFNIQVWRLFTYPFLPLSIAEAFLFFFVFWYLGPKVENSFRNYFYPISIFLFIFLQGFLTVALFGKENFYLYGTEGLSFYVLTLYYLIYFRIVSQFEPLPLRTMVQTAIVVFFWVMAATLDSFIYERNTLINSFSFAIVGIFIGALSYLQNRSFANELIQQRYRDFVNFRKRLEELESQEQQDIAETQPEETKNEIKSTEQGVLVDEFIYDEENLNKILDKIIEKGKESLTPEEIKFLENYSKKVK